MERLDGKIVFITGASAGIGRSCALKFAEAGCHLVLAARRLEKLEGVAREISKQYPKVRVHTVSLDVSDKQAVDKVVATLPTEFQAIDVLVNNAGCVYGMDIVESTPLKNVNGMLDTNVKGVVFMTQAVLPAMKKRNAGHLIHIGSIAGKFPYAHGSIYCATKAAVEAIHVSLRHELLATRVRSTLVAPGLVETEFSNVRFGGDQERAKKVYEGLQPLVGEDVAEIVVFAASRPEHVDISEVTVVPKSQFSTTLIHRQASSE